MKVLCLSPHTDDVELGCGGTMSRLVEEGHEVHVAIFSTCNKSLPENFELDTLAVESLNSLVSLGIEKNWIYYLGYEVRLFNYERQRILDDLIQIKNKVRPELVFIPSLDDYHQDHKTVAEEGVRCFKNNCSILSYELIWNNTAFSNRLYYSLSELHVSNKIKALSHYASQSHRKYMSPEFIRSLAMVRGTQNGVDFAESFEVVRYKI